MRTMTPRVTRCFGFSVLSPALCSARRISALLGAPILIALAIGLSPAPASAQANTCLQDSYAKTGATQTLKCTSGDVKVTAVDPNSLKILTGGTGTGTNAKCYAGGTFSFLGDFEILTTSSSSRSNVGIYFGTGQASALTGTCDRKIISQQHPCPGDSSTQCGSAQYDELDAAPDNCGDTSSNDSSTLFGPGTEDDTFELDDVTCPTSGTSITLPVCTSWQVPGKTIECVADTTTWDYPLSEPGDIPEAVPGSPSKCGCGMITIPIQPISPAIMVSKTCSVGSYTDKTSCDAGAGDVQTSNTTTVPITFTVTITNQTPSGQGGVVVDQVCDNQYGQVWPATGTCAAGSEGSVISTTCGSLDGLAITTSPATCTFTAVQKENETVTDTVTVSGHSNQVSGVPFTPTTSNPVTVTSSDTGTTVTTNPEPDTTTQACATVRYDVDVNNTSGADETVYLSGLSDTYYGSITSLHGVGTGVPGSVVGTTCGVDSGSSGLGTLSGKSGAGVLTPSPGAAIAPGATYHCEFDGLFCGGTMPVTEFGTGVCDTVGGHCTQGQPTSVTCAKNSDCDATCPLGIQSVNKVIASLTGDESPDNGSCNLTTGVCSAGLVGATCTQNSDCNSSDSINTTELQLTVNECLASFSASQ